MSEYLNSIKRDCDESLAASQARRNLARKTRKLQTAVFLVAFLGTVALFVVLFIFFPR